VGLNYFQEKQQKLFFYNLHLTRWAFDVEMLYIAQKTGMPIVEIPVNWREIEDSKLEIISASISFFRDYFAMIAFYNTGHWKVPEN